MSIDSSTHSLFGVSKAAADLLVQEYGRYFEMPTVAFRGGCLTGPQHAGAKLHGFLAYLMKCTVTGTPYTVFGYEGKQVRDNIHSADLIAAFDAFRKAPRAAAVYNIGGGRFSNCSMLEAIEVCERVAGRELSWEMGEEPRIGDHRWWISDLAPFQADYPDWKLRYGVEDILREMYEQNLERWTVTPRHEALGGDAGPERGGVGRGHGRRRRRRPRARGDRLRGRSSSTTTAKTRPKRSSTRSATPTRGSAATAPTTNAASGWRSGPASTSSRATRWRSSWPTPPTTPRTWSATTACSKRAGTAPSARASCPAPRSTTTRA